MLKRCLIVWGAWGRVSDCQEPNLARGPAYAGNALGEALPTHGERCGGGEWRLWKASTRR
jgi:hypothetical protein